MDTESEQLTPRHAVNMMPVTCKEINECLSQSFRKHDVTAGYVTILGKVKKSEAIADGKIVLWVDDMTATTKCINYASGSDKDSFSNLVTKIGSGYIRIFGEMKREGFSNYIVICKAESITDLNELTFHLMEAVSTGVKLKKAKDERDAKHQQRLREIEEEEAEWLRFQEEKAKKEEEIAKRKIQNEHKQDDDCPRPPSPTPPWRKGLNLYSFTPDYSKTSNRDWGSEFRLQEMKKNLNSKHKLTFLWPKKKEKIEKDSSNHHIDEETRTQKKETCKEMAAPIKDTMLITQGSQDGYRHCVLNACRSWGETGQGVTINDIILKVANVMTTENAKQKIQTMIENGDIRRIGDSKYYISRDWF